MSVLPAAIVTHPRDDAKAAAVVLKGYLALRGVAAKQLKDKFRHDLGELWAEFRTYEPDMRLSKFDRTIADLHAFEELRYPPEEGVVRAIALQKTRPSKAPSSKMRWYMLIRDELDWLTLLLFKLTNNCAHGVDLSNVGKRCLLHENECAGAWTMVGLP
jgi:hypothetical protein